MSSCRGDFLQSVHTSVKCALAVHVALLLLPKGIHATVLHCEGLSLNLV